MIRFLLNIAVSLVSALIAFWVASMIFEDFNISVQGILIATAIFTLAQAILGPAVFNLARKYASAVLGGIGLLSTLLALWVTTLIADALSIEGLGTWIGATVVVWLITALGTWLIGFFVIQRWWENREGNRNKK